jgi:hypothetical protein
MKKKNDYSIAFYNVDEKVLFLEYVHVIKTAVKWVENKGIEWTHGNVYDRHERTFLKQIKPDDINLEA